MQRKLESYCKTPTPLVQIWHYDVSKYRAAEQGKVKISLAAVAAFTAGVLVPLLVTQGPLAFVKWW